MWASRWARAGGQAGGMEATCARIPRGGTRESGRCTRDPCRRRRPPHDAAAAAACCCCVSSRPSWPPPPLSPNNTAFPPRPPLPAPPPTSPALRRPWPVACQHPAPRPPARPTTRVRRAHDDAVADAEAAVGSSHARPGGTPTMYHLAKGLYIYATSKPGP